MSSGILHQSRRPVVGSAIKAVALVLILTVSVGAARCPEARVVERAADALMAAARAGSPSQFAHAMRTYADMNAITLFALGKYRDRLPAAKRAQLVSLTTAFVSRTFNDFRLKFKAQSMVVEDCRDGTVRTVFKFRGVLGKQPVIWRLRGGRVFDVNLQSIWLGQLLRTEFYRVMAENHGDINALLRHLRK